MNLLRLAGVVQAAGNRWHQAEARANHTSHIHGCLRPGCLAALAFILFAGPVFAQQAPLGFNENVVFLDPAHGGTDPGAHFGGSVEEKNVTLALAGRLRAALAAKGFSVLASRDGDAAVTSEQRANLANHARPLACILLHATASGSGATLAVSALPPETEQRPALPWATAQASYVSESLALQEKLSAALVALKLKPILLRASVPPIDSLTCAAVTLEVAGEGVTESDYQQRAMEAVTQAIVEWKTQVVPAKTPSASPAKPATSPGDHPIPKTPPAAGVPPAAAPSGAVR